MKKYLLFLLTFFILLTFALPAKAASNQLQTHCFRTPWFTICRPTKPNPPKPPKITPPPKPTMKPSPTPSLTTTLYDDFSAASLNTNLWDFNSTDGGTYSFNNGSLVIPGGSSMFYIRSKDNPFPAFGPFTVEFGIQYSLVDESGIGVALGFEQQNGYDPSNVPVAYWQGNNLGLQVARFGLTGAVIGNNPDLNYHIGKIHYDGDKYTVYLDGVLKYTSPSSLTAKSLWFGNPFCCRTNWSGFNLDYIKVTTP